MYNHKAVQQAIDKDKSISKKEGQHCQSCIAAAAFYGADAHRCDSIEEQAYWFMRGAEILRKHQHLFQLGGRLSCACQAHALLKGRQATHSSGLNPNGRGLVNEVLRQREL